MFIMKISLIICLNLFLQNLSVLGVEESSYDDFDPYAVKSLKNSLMKMKDNLKNFSEWMDAASDSVNAFSAIGSLLVKSSKAIFLSNSSEFKAINELQEVIKSLKNLSPNTAENAVFYFSLEDKEYTSIVDVPLGFFVKKLNFLILNNMSVTSEVFTGDVCHPQSAHRPLHALQYLEQKLVDKCNFSGHAHHAESAQNYALGLHFFNLLESRFPLPTDFHGAFGYSFTKLELLLRISPIIPEEVEQFLRHSIPDINVTQFYFNHQLDIIVKRLPRYFENKYYQCYTDFYVKECGYHYPCIFGEFKKVIFDAMEASFYSSICSNFIHENHTIHKEMELLRIRESFTSIIKLQKSYLLNELDSIWNAKFMQEYVLKILQNYDFTKNYTIAANKLEMALNEIGNPMWSHNVIIADKATKHKFVICDPFFCMQTEIKDTVYVFIIRHQKASAAERALKAQEWFNSTMPKMDAIINRIFFEEPEIIAKEFSKELQSNLTEYYHTFILFQNSHILPEFTEIAAEMSHENPVGGVDPYAIKENLNLKGFWIYRNQLVWVL